MQFLRSFLLHCGRQQWFEFGKEKEILSLFYGLPPPTQFYDTVKSWGGEEGYACKQNTCLQNL